MTNKLENKISVIVTTYNQERTIGRTLDSILVQQCSLPIEIVVGDDCSTDGTRCVVEQYINRTKEKANGKFEIKLLANERNKGIVDNYFGCLMACSGQYIADCAGDDYWCDILKLEKELRILEQYPDVTLVHTNWRFADTSKGLYADAGTLSFRQPFTPGCDMLEAIVCQERHVVHLCTALYRKETVLEACSENKLLFPNNDWACEDIPIVFMLALKGNVAYLSEVTLNYSIGNESVSNHADPVEQFKFVAAITQLSHYLSSTYHISGKRVDEFFENRLYALSMHAFRAHNREMRDGLLELKRQWSVGNTPKLRRVNYIMSHRLLWSVALMVRSGYLQMKKLVMW